MVTSEEQDRIRRRQEAAVRQAEAVLLRRWWDEGLSVDELIERSGLSRETVGNRLSKTGITPQDRRERRYVESGRLPNGAWPLCRSCGTVFDAPSARREFCGPACATKWNTDHTKRPRVVRTPEEIKAQRQRWLRKFHAERQWIMRWVFAGRPLPEWLKEQEANR